MYGMYGMYVYANQRMTVRLFLSLHCDLVIWLGSGDREELSS